MKIFVKAKPNSKEEKIEQFDELSYVVSVKEPPVRGLANEAIMRLVASYFKVPAMYVKIISGHASRHKIIEITGK